MWAAGGAEGKERDDAAAYVGRGKSRAARVGLARARGDGGRAHGRDRRARADGGRDPGGAPRPGARRRRRGEHGRDDARQVHHRLVRSLQRYPDAPRRAPARPASLGHDHAVRDRRPPPRFDHGVNRAVEGVEAKIAVHVCFGNLYGRPFSAVRDFKNLYPTLRDLRASQIVLEFANRGMDDLKFWKEFPTDKELGAGVIDVKAFKAESAADVAERVRALLKHVAPDKLWLNPDCGFWETPRWVVKQKLAALVEGAGIVRKELGG